MQNHVSCCPGRPAHSGSRAFFQAAATLALIAGGVSGSLSTQAMAADYVNPLGTTVGLLSYTNGSSPTNITNAGEALGLALRYGTSVTNVLITSTGSITNSGTYDNGVVLDTNCGITTLTNNGTIMGRYGIEMSNNASIQTFNNNGALISRDWAIVMNMNSTITNFNNAGSFTGATEPQQAFTRIRRDGNRITLIAAKHQDVPLVIITLEEPNVPIRPTWISAREHSEVAFLRLIYRLPPIKERPSHVRPCALNTGLLQRRVDECRTPCRRRRVEVRTAGG